MQAVLSGVDSSHYARAAGVRGMRHAVGVLEIADSGVEFTCGDKQLRGAGFVRFCRSNELGKP
jgi:hypothetical protein